MERDVVTRGWIEERLDVIHPTHVVGMVRLLRELRLLFDGDLDAMLVLAATSVSIEGEGWKEMLFEQQPLLRATMNQTNTQSIAFITQIPRETVRRKLIWLQARGWVERDDAGNWHPTLAASKDVASATEATITYLKLILSAALKAGKSGPAKR